MTDRTWTVRLATIQTILDNLDEIMPGSDSSGYYAGYCDAGYQEARDHVEKYLADRLTAGLESC